MAKYKALSDVLIRRISQRMIRTNWGKWDYKYMRIASGQYRVFRVSGEGHPIVCDCTFEKDAKLIVFLYNSFPGLIKALDAWMLKAGDKGLFLP